MKVEITDFNVDWLKIKSGCMTTISKKAGKEPNREWKRKLLVCQHSPLRRGVISWKWDEIPYAISTHFARHHEGCEKFISTSRTDRTGVKREERSQMDNVMMEMDANIQALLNISERRLCTCADPLTRAYMEELKDAIAEYDEDIAWALAPSGIYKCGCPEKFGDCNYCTNILKQMPQEDLFDIEKRLDYYNEYREKVKVKKLCKKNGKI